MKKNMTFFDWSTGTAIKTHHFNTPILQYSNTPVLPVHRAVTVNLETGLMLS
jgi:hypothetical protein